MDTELAVIYLLLSWKIDHSWIDYPVLKLAPLRSWGFNNEPVCVSRDSLPTVYKIYGCYDVHVNIKIRWNFKSQLKPTPKMLWVCYCVWNAISHLFFYVRYPSTGPHVQCVEVWGTSHNCTECAWLSRVMGYAGTASDLLSECAADVCTHQRTISGQTLACSSHLMAQAS